MRTTLRSLTFVTALVALAIAASSCSGQINNFPTTATPVPVTETFTGTLGKNGAITHTFFSSATGAVTASLTQLDPAETTNVGFSMGTYTGSTCSVLLANDNAVKTSVITATVTSIGGSLCVRVYDIGKLAPSAETTYEVQVVHP